MSEERNKKRQKTNNKGGEEDEFNLKSKTIPQLLLIADENGASFKKSTKKQELVEKLSIILMNKKDTLEKQDIDKNINSYNKQVIEFTIKDGIVPLEWLFWKIIRNKFIFRQIMSNMSHLSRSYDSIKCVTSIIESKQLAILRDKVIRNQYLTFTTTESGDPIIKIFKSIKSNDGDDILFYQKLFKNYSKNVYQLNYSKDSLIMDGSKNDRDKLVNIIIQAKCLPALQVLIQDYGYIPTQSNLVVSIKQGALKLIDIFLKKQFKLSIVTKEIIGTHIGTNNFHGLLKSFNHLHCKKIISVTNNSPDALTPEGNYRTILDDIVCVGFPNKINQYTKLKSLLIIGKLILETIKNNTFPNANVTKASEINISIEEIESFSKTMTKEQLKSMLDHKSNQQEPNREIIIKLLELYHLFSSIDKPTVYNSHFNNEVKGESLQVLENSFQFANFASLPVSIRNEQIIQYFYNNLKEPHPDFIFSHCNDKEKQLQFVNLFIENCFPTSKIIKPILFFYLIINSDDLELIKLVSSKLPIDQEEGVGSTPLIITRFIKSNETLDWLYENHKNHFKSDSWWYFSNLNLLKHYQSLNDNGRLKVPSFYGHLSGYLSGYLSNKWIKYYSNDLIQYIIDCGPSIFEIKFPFDIYWLIFKYSKNQYGTCTMLNTFEIYKSIYLTFFQPNIQPTEMKSNERIIYLQKKTTLLPKMYQKSFEFVKFIDWLYINFNNELKDNGIFGFGMSDYYVSLYTERYSNITDISKFDSNKLYIVENIRLLEYVLKLLFSSDNNNNITKPKRDSILTSILSGCLHGGNLKSIQFIHLNYPIVLKRKLPKNDGIFTLDQLKSVIIKSLKFDHIELLEYIFNLITFNKNDFVNANIGDLSRLYFLNRFK